MEILFDVIGNEPRNVGVYCVRREIKFLIGPLHRIQACHFRSIAEIARCICVEMLLNRDETCAQNLFIRKLQKFISIRWMMIFFHEIHKYIIAINTKLLIVIKYFNVSNGLTFSLLCNTIRIKFIQWKKEVSLQIWAINIFFKDKIDKNMQIFRRTNLFYYSHIILSSRNNFPSCGSIRMDRIYESEWNLVSRHVQQSVVEPETFAQNLFPRKRCLPYNIHVKKKRVPKSTGLRTMRYTVANELDLPPANMAQVFVGCKYYIWIPISHLTLSPDVVWDSIW